MSKPSFQNLAFQQTAPGPGFNLINQVNSFNAFIDARPLDPKEANEIDRLLHENFVPGQIDEGQPSKDAEELKTLSSEIKAIGRQGIVLVGERVHRAREILKNYKDGTFTKWLDATFDSKKTAYNRLNYFEFYRSLPPSLQEPFKRIPQKAAYILASREGSIEKKEEIIREYSDMEVKDLVPLIQEMLPAASNDKRSTKSSNDRLIDSLREVFKKIRKRKDTLSEKNKDDLQGLMAKMLSEIFDVLKICNCYISKIIIGFYVYSLSFSELHMKTSRFFLPYFAYSFSR